jgi:hypothetical protein
MTDYVFLSGYLFPKMGMKDDRFFYAFKREIK